MNQSQLQPVVFGGLFIGVLSALPIISIGNVCCCLWIVGGGMLTAYLQQRDRAEPLPLGEGAIGGLLAGVAGSVVYVAVSIPIGIVTAPFQRRMIEFMMNSGSDVPPEVREMLDGFGAEGMIAGVAIGFVSMLVAGIVFATLGGMFGALLFRPSTPPAPPAPPHMPPSQSWAPPSPRSQLESGGGPQPPAPAPPPVPAPPPETPPAPPRAEAPPPPASPETPPASPPPAPPPPREPDA